MGIDSIRRFLFASFLLGLLWIGCTADLPSEELGVEASRLIDDALITQESGYIQLALAFVDSAVTLQPNHAVPHFLRAQLLNELSDVGGSEAAYKEALNYDPDYQDAWFQLGNIAFSKRSYSEALANYEQEAAVLERKSNRYGAAFRVQYQESMSQLELQKGRAFRQLGEVEQAREAFARSIELDTLNTAAYSDMSQALQEAGLEADALQYAQKALELNPLNPDYLFQVGSLLFDIGRAEESLPLLQGALQQKPWLSSALYKLGLAMISLEDEERGTAYVQMADSLQAQNERINKARFNAQQYADEPERWITLAQLLLEVGRIDEAITPLNTAYSLDPTNLSVQNDLANLALVGGDTTAAKIRLEKILDENPMFVEGWFNLGVIHAMQGNYKQARLHWKNTLQLDPTHQEAKTYLVRLEE